MANKVLVGQMKYYNKYYIDSGNTAISRCIESTALRIDEGRSVPDDMQKTFRRDSKISLINDIADRKRQNSVSSKGGASSEHQINEAHERILRELLEDDGEDNALAKQFLEESELGFHVDDGERENRKSILEAYIRESAGKLGDGSTNPTTVPKLKRASLALEDARMQMKLFSQTIAEGHESFDDDSCVSDDSVVSDFPDDDGFSV